MIKAIVQDFKEYKSHLNEWLFLRRFNLKLTLYSKLADMHHRASGLKTRVVIVGNDRKFEIWNKRTIDRAKRPTVRVGKLRMKDGSSKKIKQIIPPRIPRSWGSLEINHITFYMVGGNTPLTPQEREEYRIKFNAYAKRFLK